MRIESLTSGPITVGSRYKSYGEVAGQQNRHNELRAMKYEPPTRFTFTAQDPDGMQIALFQTSEANDVDKF